MSEIFKDVQVKCQCFDDCNNCVCGPQEKVLRAYSIWGEKQHLPKMTPEQREWCLQEVEKMEGYSREDYQDADDRNLATGVLSSWRDYCRDKGIY